MTGSSFVMSVGLLQGAYLESHLRKIAEYPGGNGIHARRIYTRNRPGVDQPGLPTLDIGLRIDMRGMAMAVAYQIVISGAGESLPVVGHVSDEYLAPTELQHGFLSVISEQAAVLCHHAVQRLDIADIVAVNRVNGNTEFERSAQGVYADQVATVDNRLNPRCLRLGDGGGQ